MRSARLVSARGSVLIPLLLLGLALVAGPAVAAPPESPSPGGSCPRATFSRTFTNHTGVEVDGLLLSLHGPTAASGFYTGPENPFGEPELHGAGPDGSYRLRFSGGPVAPGESVRITFCVDVESAAVVPLGSDAAQYWRVGGEPLRESEEAQTVPQALAAVGLELRAEEAGEGSYQLYLEVTAAELGEIELESLEVALVPEAPPVDAFGGGLEGQPFQPLVPGPVVLEPRIADEGASRFSVPVPGIFRYDEPGVLLARFAAAPVGSPEGRVEGAGSAGLATFLHPQFLQAKAIEAVAARTGIAPDELVVGTAVLADYPLQGTTAHGFKLTDGTGEVHGVALDPHGGELDPALLDAQEQVLHDQVYGRLDPELAAHLQQVPPGTPVAVDLWAAVDPAVAEGGPQRPDTEAQLDEAEIDGLLAEVGSYHRNVAAAALGPVLAALGAVGADVFEVDESAPLVHAELTTDQVQQLAYHDAIDRIYLGGGEYQDFMATAGPTVRSNVLHGIGVTGTGTRVGFVEIDGRVPPGNWFLQPNGSCPWPSGGVIQDAFACAAPNAHSTAVGGIIKSTGIETGIAPTTCLWAGGACSNQAGPLQAAANRARNWGARAINLSWGSYAGTGPGAMDRFFDDMVINNWRTIVIAAGNGASPCFPGTGITGSPARAYNVITVGNFDDRNTVPLGDDVVGICSSFVDPTSQHGDREKPEVAAPGTSLRSTTTFHPWEGAIGSGTSFAAPIVTGGAADLFQVRSALNVWPEATKAIFMATAVHNVEGRTRMSEFDGAGGVALDHARDVAINQWGGRAYNCGSPSNLDVQTIFLRRDQRARVVLNWTTPGSGWNQYANRPSADLDLRVLDPNGNTVASSLSWDNTFEIVDFMPRITGNYRIRVHKYRCNQSPRYIAWAWWQDQWMMIDGMGWEGEGAGLDVYDINGNGTPDLLLMVYDAPWNDNNFRYKIGWDMDNLGRASSWTSYPQVGGLGWLGQGAGVELVNLDSNPRPEMVLLAYDAPSGANNFRYKIGWNMTTAGVPLWWTSYPQISGVGWEGQGAGIEFLNLDSNPRPDMVIMAYDNPSGANNFRYKIGWNVNSAGVPSFWSGFPQVGGVGWEGQGAGVTLANLFGSSRPEMLMMAYDNPWGANTFRYRIGQDTSTGGVPSSWGGMTLIDGVGWEADGADPELYDIDNDGLFELFLMAYDDPWGANTFRYRVVEP